MRFSVDGPGIVGAPSVQPLPTALVCSKGCYMVPVWIVYRRLRWWVRSSQQTTRLASGIYLSLLTLAVAIVLPVCSMVSATQLVPMTLQSVAQRAELAFAGTVQEIGFTRLEGQSVTVVRFSDLRIVGERQQKELT